MMRGGPELLVVVGALSIRREVPMDGQVHIG